jgi:hypothetical protein
MRLRDFIRKHKKEIDEYIHGEVPDLHLNDEERENWIRNDVVLYHWARSHGMNV